MKQKVHPNNMMSLDLMPLGYCAKEINLPVIHTTVCNEPVPYFPQALQTRTVGQESTAQGKWQTIWFRKTRKYKMYGGNHCLYYFQRQN